MGKNGIEIHGVLIHFIVSIRMEREGVEKAGGCGFDERAQRMRIGGGKARRYRFQRETREQRRMAT
jgi:hypothetical protein